MFSISFYSTIFLSVNFINGVIIVGLEDGLPVETYLPRQPFGHPFIVGDAEFNDSKNENLKKWSSDMTNNVVKSVRDNYGDYSSQKTRYIIAELPLFYSPRENGAMIQLFSIGIIGIEHSVHPEMTLLHRKYPSKGEEVTCDRTLAPRIDDYYFMRIQFYFEKLEIEAGYNIHKIDPTDLEKQSTIITQTGELKLLFLQVQVTVSVRTAQIDKQFVCDDNPKNPMAREGINFTPPFLDIKYDVKKIEGLKNKPLPDNGPHIDYLLNSITTDSHEISRRIWQHILPKFQEKVFKMEDKLQLWSLLWKSFDLNKTKKP